MYEISMVNMKDGSRKVKLVSPYNPNLSRQARAIGGQWNGTVKAWYFHEQVEKRVHELAKSIWGELGEETVTVHIDLNEFRMNDALWIGPFQVLQKWDRDRAPQLLHGAWVHSGSLDDFGGSRNHPRITHDNAVIALPGMPISIAESLADGSAIMIV